MTERRPQPTTDPSPPESRATSGTGAAFVGRGSEMESLLIGLEAALTGRGRLFLVGGEPGIGKTRLADKFAVEARARGARVLWGRCWEAGGAPAYYPWIQVVRTLLRDLDATDLRTSLGTEAADLAPMIPELWEGLPEPPRPRPASPEVARFRLFDAVSAFLRRASETQPLVLILEDLHAADASSLLLLRFVTGEAPGARLLLLGTYRDADLTRDHVLAQLLPELVRAVGAARVPLAGLDEPDVARFIGAMVGYEPPDELVASIHGETGGNPLFVGEMVRLLAAEGRLAERVWTQRWPIPEGVREVIGRRLDRLPTRSRELLTLGAVIGRDFTVDVLERVAAEPAEEILELVDEAIVAGVVLDLVEDPGRFRFSHGLVRDVLYEELSSGDRVRLHRTVGEALEEVYAGDRESHVAELAHHFFEAAPTGRVDEAVDYAVAAGERAVAQLAYEEAVSRFRMAQVLLRESPDEQRRAEVLLRLGDAQGRAGATADSKETFLEAAEAATRLAEPELLARAAIGYGGRFQFARAGIDRHVVPLLTQALASLDEEDSALHVRLMARLAGALRDQPSLEPRTSLSREAVAMARRIGDPDTLTYALIGWWGAALLGPDGLDEMDDVADELDRLADESGDPELRTNSTWVRFIAALTRGDVWEARAQLALTERLVRELGQPPQRWYTRLMATNLALQDGRFEDAEQLIEETYSVGRRSMPWDAELTHLFTLFVLRREQGRLEEIEDGLRRLLATHPGYRSVRCMILATLCEAGRLDEARALFDRLAADDFAAFPKDNEWLFALTLLSESAAVLDDRERAAVLYEQLAPYADHVVLAADEVSVGPVTRPLGILAGVLGRHDDVARHFDDALGRTRRMGAHPWVAHTEHAYAAVLTARDHPGDRDRAAALLTDAAEICAELSMSALGSRVDALLAELGVRPRGARDVGPAPPEWTSPAMALTPREREVAGVVAEGLSNRAIAERLYISQRTVETHVQNILMKLGFTSRTQIAAWAVREEPTTELT